MSADGRQVIDLYHQLVGASLRQTPFDASSQTAFKAWQHKARRILRGIEAHDGAHEISGKRSIPWMLKQLKDNQ